MATKKELIAEAFGLTFALGPIWKIKKKSPQMIKYGTSGKIFSPDVKEFDAISVAI